MMQSLESLVWYEYLDHGQQDLVRVARALLRREVEETQHKFHDYSFIVFPMAKAYEGFVKKFLYDLQVISEGQYRGKHFRIGKSLNPDLPEKYRRGDWVVEKLNEVCGETEGGELVSRLLWRQWKENRNLLFHYFPNHVHFITLSDAGERLGQLEMAMEVAIKCPVFVKGVK